MATKKEEDKIVIKAFRDSSSNWWVGYKHYCLDENNILQFVCGGIEDKKETEAIQEFIKRNKKSFQRKEIKFNKRVKPKFRILERTF